MKKLSKLYAGLSIFLLVLLAPLSLLAADYYAAPNSLGTGDCSSPTDACELQTALDAAAGNGKDDTIHLGAGTYDASVATFTYQPIDPENYALNIEGAAIDTTVLDGGGANQNLNIKTTGLSNDSNAHITIKNMTFQNGYAYDGAGFNAGGGVHVRTDSANIALKDSKFNGNSAYWEGGGADIYSLDGSVSLINNTFNENSAYFYGGGTSAYSQNGTVTLTNNTFDENSIEDYGGGAKVFSYSGTVNLTNNTFTRNSANIHGGGVEVSSTLGTVNLTNNTFSGNSARNYGGGAHIYLYSEGTATLTNNTFSGNSTNGEGGGTYIILIDNNSTANIYNNIVWNNTAAQYWSDISVIDDGNNDGLGAEVDLYNNDYGDLYIKVGDNLQEGNNIDADPLFVDATNDDFHLQAGSPCIDKGHPNAPELPDEDFEGDDRIIGTAPDIGADEFALATIEDILDFFDQSVKDDELYGRGRGWIAKLRLYFLRKMLVMAGRYIERDTINFACFMLERAYLRSDGLPWPRDFVVGDATDDLAYMIHDLAASLGCEWVGPEYDVVVYSYTDEQDKSWIDIELKDDEGKPMPFQDYIIYLPDGTVAKGTLDENGRARERSDKPGTCHIIFPNLDKEAWERV